MTNPKIRIDADISGAEQALADFRAEVADLKKEMASATGKHRIENEFQAAGNALSKLMSKYDQLLAKLNSAEKSGKRYANILKEVADLTSEAAKVSLKVEDAGSLKSKRSSYFFDENQLHRSEQQSIIDQMRRDASMERNESNRSKWFNKAVGFAGFAGGAALGGGGVMATAGSGVGSLLNLIPGVGPILGAFGAAAGGKLGGMADAAYGPAKEEAIALADLRRAVGSTRVDFEALRESVRDASEGFGITYLEAVNLARQFSDTSAAMDVGKSVNTGTGFARGYGMSPGQGVGFFGAMRLSGATRDDNGDRRLASLIAESVARSGTTQKMGEVLSAIASFASLSSRTLLKSNISDYLSNLTGLMGSNTAGLSKNPQSAAMLLGRANDSYMAGGAMGDASKLFMLQSFTNANSNINAIDAKMLQEAGMFAPMSTVFGKNSPMYNAAKKNKDAGLLAHYDKLAGSGQTGFGMISAEMDRRFGGDTQAKALNFTGMFGGNLNQNAALMNMVGSKGLGGLSKKLDDYGISMERADLSKMGQYAAILSGDREGAYKSFMKSDKLSADDKSTLERVKSAGNTQEMERLLLELTDKFGGDQGQDVRKATVDMSNALQDKMDNLIDVETASKDFLAEILRSTDPKNRLIKSYDADRDSSVFKGIGGIWDNLTASPSRREQEYNKKRITEEAIRQGVDPALAVAMAYKESSLLTSREGQLQTSGPHKGDKAFGLYQYMSKSSEGWDRFNSNENIRHGIADLKANLKRFGGNEGFAVAAHLTGPNRKEYGQGQYPVINDNLGSTAESYANDVLAIRDQFKQQMPNSEAKKSNNISINVNGAVTLHDKNGNSIADPTPLSTSVSSPMPQGIR